MSVSLPLTGWPNQVLSTLSEVIELIADDAETEHFKIGRTNDVEKRQAEYGREYNVPPDTLVGLYETDSADHAIDVEGALIDAFYEHPKCLNEADHGGGNVSDEWAQFVYVAVWGEHA